ncbi:MAG: M48 family metallopeptidase [Campylobacterota bacterium]
MHILKKIVLLVLTLSFIVGCTQKTPYTNRSQMIFMSQKEELSLGEKSYNEVLKKEEVIKNTKDANLVKQVGKKIANVANKPSFNWEFNLVKNDEINAFCLPGGKVVVYTGILKIAKNEDQLATVIAHEVAHALARHGAERVSSAMLQQGVQAVGNIVLQTAAPEYTNIFNQAYGVGTNLAIMLPYSRLQESEADEIGIYLMAKAGYDLDEAVKFWENMSKSSKESIEFLSTHPSNKTRIENLIKLIKKIKKT